MKAQVGLYHVSRNMENWNVYQYNHVTATSNSSTKIESFPYLEDAIKEMYKLNGWKEPKNILQRN